MKKLLSIWLMLIPSLGFCDTKISAFPSTTTLATTDIIPVVVTPATTPANKIITFQNFYNAIPSTITATSLGVLTTSSATATYLQLSSATATYLAQPTASTTYLTQSSATATYLQLSSATATYQKIGTGGSGGYALQPATVTIVAALGVTLPDNTSVSTGAINLSQLANVASANAIINGNMNFWQRNTTFASPAQSIYTADRWEIDPVLTGPAGTWSVQRISTVTMNSQYSLSMNVTSRSAGKTYAVSQQIENYYEYLGSSVTLTVWVNSNEATTVGIRDNLGTSTSSAHAGDSAWHQLSVTRFIATTATSLTVTLGNDAPSSTCVRYFDGVMLVPGNAPINFVPRPLATEFALCQRYYFKTFDPTTVPAQNTGSALGALTYSIVIAGATQNSTVLPFPVQMRAAPTITTYSIGAASSAWWDISTAAASGTASIPGTGPSTRNVDIRNAQAAGDAAGNLEGIHLTAESEM